LPEQRTEFGEHTPVHAALFPVWVQTLLVQATAAPQVPAELHVCTPLPEH